MNDSDPSPINLDELRLLPDWLREEGPAPSKQYASHDYPTEERSGRGRDQRSGGFGRDRRDARGGAGGPPDRRREGGPRPGSPPRQGGGRPFRDERGNAGGPPPAPTPPAPVHVEFLPDERCLASINKQIRSTHLAYPLFGLARMFLQEPERHLVQFALGPEAVAAGVMLYQLGEDGPITLDRQTLEKIAFDESKDKFYVEETVQKEPLKGNFVNVARDRQSGTLLGPTNHHGYQPALRALYEARFSRRMSFEDFRRGIEVSTDAALIERWKEEARTTTTISTREETPVTLQNPGEARQHFRQHYFEGLLRTGTRLSVHGSVARKLPEAGMMQAIREAHDRELRYPAQFVQLLRQGLQNAGLHIFKHRKRIVYVSLARPTPFAAHGAVSENVKAILETIAQSPLCTRKTLAEHVLSRHTSGAPAPVSEAPSPVEESAAPVEAGAPAAETEASHPEAVEPTGETAVQTHAPTPPLPVPVAEDPFAKGKAALAADLRFLVQSGHIIEFHNGTFDLPLPPKPKEEPNPARASGPRKPSEAPRSAEIAKDPVAPESESAAEGTDDPSPEGETPFAAMATDDEPIESNDGSTMDETGSVESPAEHPMAAAVLEESSEKPADSALP